MGAVVVDSAGLFWQPASSARTKTRAHNSVFFNFMA